MFSFHLFFFSDQSFFNNWSMRFVDGKKREKAMNIKIKGSHEDRFHFVNLLQSMIMIAKMMMYVWLTKEIKK